MALFAFGLAAWLVAGAISQVAFDRAQGFVLSVPGLAVLFLLTLAIFYHLCNGIRHLIWDSVHAFELRSIYAGGWAVVVASLILTTALWLWMLK